jgi:hypothetical protein
MAAAVFKSLEKLAAEFSKVWNMCGGRKADPCRLARKVKKFCG